MKDQKIKMSLVLPIYNVEQYLPECLDSVAKQAMDGLEIICVNDGSTDGGLGIIEEYAEKDNRIQIITKENGGLGAARNTGFDAATGEYIWFVDSDDLIAPNACQKVYSHAKENESDIVLIDVGLYWGKINPVLDFLDTKKYKKMARLGKFTISDAPWIQQTHSVWSRIYRRDFLLEYGLRNPEQRFGEDMLFSYMTAVCAKCITIFPEKLYFYRQDRKGSLLSEETQRDDYKMMYVQSMRETKEFLVKTGTYELLKEDFLTGRIRWALPRQKGFRSRKLFFDFFHQLRSILEEEDFKLLDSCFYLDQYQGVREYIEALRKNKAVSYYIHYKWRKIFWAERLFYAFRIPKTNFVIRVPRLHYFKRQENDRLNYELAKISYELQVMNNNLRQLEQDGASAQLEERGEERDEGKRDFC